MQKSRLRTPAARGARHAPPRGHNKTLALAYAFVHI
jgi:hypothetical protein